MKWQCTVWVQYGCGCRVGAVRLWTLSFSQCANLCYSTLYSATRKHAQHTSVCYAHDALILITHNARAVVWCAASSNLINNCAGTPSPCFVLRFFAFRELRVMRICGFTDLRICGFHRIHGFPRIPQNSTDSTDSGKKGEKKGKCDKKNKIPESARIPKISRIPVRIPRIPMYGFHGFPHKKITEWARP